MIGDDSGDRGVSKATGTTGLVLAGGGARGAYELGVLSTLLPRLEQEGWERPQIIVGTSVGAINAAYLAATAEKSLDDQLADGRKLWLDMGWGQALNQLSSLRQIGLTVDSLLDAFGVPGFHSRSLLSPAPLKQTLDQDAVEAGKQIRGVIPFRQIRKNLEEDHLKTAAVVTTRASSSLSVVFYDSESKEPPPPDNILRGISYEREPLTVEHVLASAAIPAVFPAQWVSTPARVKGWYYDGGTRLNAPIKPALDLDAERLIIVALHSYRLGWKDAKPPDILLQRPETVDGAAQLIQAVLIDPLVNDVQTLATINQLVESGGNDKKVIPYILIAPPQAYEIAEIATDCYEQSGYSRFSSIGWLGRRLDVEKGNPVRGELLSYVLFNKMFAEELIKLGQRDANTWLDDKSHDRWPWRTLPPPD